MSTHAGVPPAAEFDPDATYGFADAVRDYIERVRGGEFGSLPAVLGLVSLLAIFTILEGRTFFSTFNFANLLSQGAMIIVIAMGLVFVLLLGEIDLSSGFVAGTSGAVLGVTLTEQGWPLPFALAACLVTGVLIGLFVGVLVARLGIPSFVVTLAMFLALQGMMLLIIGEGGTIGISNDFIFAIQNKNLAPWAGWALALIIVGGFTLVSGRRLIRRQAAGLGGEPRSVWAAKVAALAIIAAVATFYLNRERSRNPDITSIKGVPYIIPLILALLVILTFILTRTAFGRHVYAIGGNAEAARRAGIAVQRIKVTCFIACSVLAAVAGILFASRDGSISPSTGGSTTLLYAVGAAVIGGTSLFGGRGKISDAVVGGLVVAVIANGLPLVTEKAGIQFVVTGLVLLIAASVDALSRRKSIITT
jgi:D-xylose transport system permease protein